MQYSVEPIAPGYDLALPLAYRNEDADALFLSEGVLVSQFRADIDDEAPLFEARSDAGSITLERGDTETLITILLPASATAVMKDGSEVVFDLIRIDGETRDVIPGRWFWPVRKAVTRNVL